MKIETPDYTKNTCNFRLWLQSQLTDRCRRNPKYSLRAFAQLLKMDASSVSQILSGKRHVSPKIIAKICAILGVAPHQVALFIENAQRKKKGEREESFTQSMHFEQIALDAFAVISDWHHYAILELTSVEGFQNNPAFISKAIGISVSEAKASIERMRRLNLLREENGSLVKTNQFVTNALPGATSAALKNLQRQVISRALEAVDDVPQDEKDITSITMAIDPVKLPEARKKIARFRRELCAFLEDGTQTRVYQMGIQLYPISK